MNSNASKLFLLLAVSISLCSCKGERVDHAEVISEWIGREIVLPDGLVYRIQDDTVGLNLNRQDFKIVSYIDSSGCTSCRMKLSRWSEVIDELKSIADTDVEVITIVNTDDPQEIISQLHRDNYLSPVALDPDNVFDSINALPPSADHHCFLLDADNRVIAIGNPAYNPKIKDLFIRYIIGDQEVARADLVKRRLSRNLGVLRPGDKATKVFYVTGHDSTGCTLQDIVPSCDCVEATTEVLPEMQSHRITVTFTADSVRGSFCRYVDVFFNEKETPERLTVYGYIK